jgi:predicted dehydrogenase
MVHDHVWGELPKWKQQPNVDIVAAGDVNQDLLDRVQRDFGVQKLYHTWEEMIEKEELDIIQAASENSKCADIVEAAAAKGIHVVSEKPMAARLSQADRMLAAAKKANIKLMINWPTAWYPALQTMAGLIQEGAIGKVFYFKFRSAHNGPKEIGCDPHFWKWLYDEELNGAGSLMDYCCYSANMCAYFLGSPKKVTGFRGVFVKDYPIPDDNAIILSQYEHAFGVAEASWTQPVGYATPNPVAYGTEGSLVLWQDKVLLQRVNEEQKTIDPKPLEPGYRTAPEFFLRCLETGEPITGMVSPEVSRNAQEILEAGYRSANTGIAQELPLKD